MAATMRYYALEVNWKYVIICSPSEIPDFMSNDHLKNVQEKVFIDKEKDPSGVLYGSKAYDMMKHILEYAKGSYLIGRESVYNLDLGQARRYEIQFPKYLVIRTVNMKLPEGIFSGRAEMMIYHNENYHTPMATYETVMQGFRIEETTKSRADDYISKFPLHHVAQPMIASSTPPQIVTPPKK
ncbi:TPA_asm: M [Schiedea betacytorhabdovirus 1]|nr:TPA_asm: M [Schiedea betacytorhabdovirus 1]